MTPLKNVSRFGNTDSVGFSLGIALFGSCFLAIGVYGLFDTIGVNSLSGCCGVGALPPSMWFGLLLYLAFGVMIVWGGLRAAGIARRFGPPEAATVEAVVRPGEAFHFSYRQTVRRRTDIRSIEVYLVFRERVEYYDGSETQIRDFDRLIEPVRLEGRAYEAGETLLLEQVFRIPERIMGTRNPYRERPKAQTVAMWVVKVHLDLGKEDHVWREYQMVSGEMGTRLSEPPTVPNVTFDLFLTGTPFVGMMRIMKVLTALSPHLHSGQIGDLYHSSPSLVLERVSEADALAAKEQLEAAGATVEIRAGVDEVE